MCKQQSCMNQLRSRSCHQVGRDCLLVPNHCKSAPPRQSAVVSPPRHPCLLALQLLPRLGWQGVPALARAAPCCLQQMQRRSLVAVRNASGSYTGRCSRLQVRIPMTLRECQCTVAQERLGLALGRLLACTARSGALQCKPVHRSCSNQLRQSVKGFCRSCPVCSPALP